MRWLFGLFVGEVLANYLASSLGCVAQGLLLNGDFFSTSFDSLIPTRVRFPPLLSWGQSDYLLGPIFFGKQGKQGRRAGGGQKI